MHSKIEQGLVYDTPNSGGSLELRPALYDERVDFARERHNPT